MESNRNIKLNNKKTEFLTLLLKRNIQVLFLNTNNKAAESIFKRRKKIPGKLSKLKCKTCIVFRLLTVRNGIAES